MVKILKSVSAKGIWLFNGLSMLLALLLFFLILQIQSVLKIIARFFFWVITGKWGEGEVKKVV